MNLRRDHFHTAGFVEVCASFAKTPHTSQRPLYPLNTTNPRTFYLKERFGAAPLLLCGSLARGGAIRFARRPRPRDLQRCAGGSILSFIHKSSLCNLQNLNQLSKPKTTLSNGYLGSRNDEDRSEMRYVMRTAEFENHQTVERNLHFFARRSIHV